MADLQELLQEQRQALIDKNPMRANQCPASHDCQEPGQEVLIQACDPDKHDRTIHHSFSARQWHRVATQRNPRARERVNIRRLRPCHREQVCYQDFYPSGMVPLSSVFGSQSKFHCQAAATRCRMRRVWTHSHCESQIFILHSNESTIIRTHFN
jgi:hypothetical protein